MKKMIILVLIQIIIYTVYIKSKNKNLEFIYNEDYVLVFYEYNNSITAKKRIKLTNDSIRDIYSYMTIYKNNSELNYESSLSSNSYIRYYDIIDNNVYLYVNEFNFNSKAYECLKRSFKSLGYNELYVFSLN